MVKPGKQLKLHLFDQIIPTFLLWTNRCCQLDQAVVTDQLVPILWADSKLPNERTRRTVELQVDLTQSFYYGMWLLLMEMWDWEKSGVYLRDISQSQRERRQWLVRPRQRGQHLFSFWQLDIFSNLFHTSRNVFQGIILFPIKPIKVFRAAGIAKTVIK